MGRALSIYFISKQTGTEQLVGNNFFGTKTLPQVKKTIRINSGSCASTTCLAWSVAQAQRAVHSATPGSKLGAHRISVQLHGNEEQISPVKKNNLSTSAPY
jgi:hypothetical protein